MPEEKYLPDLKKFKNIPGTTDVRSSEYFNYDPSRHDKQILQEDLGRLNEIRFENQSTLDRLGVASANLIPNIVLGIGETAGYLFDLEDWYNTLTGTGGEYGNALTQAMQKYKDPFGPVYTSGETDITSAAWWISNGFGMVESAAEFGLTGFGIGSLTGKAAMGLAKTLGGGSQVLRAGSQLVTARALAYTESAMSGTEVYRSSYQDRYNFKLAELLESGLSEEEAKIEADRVARIGAGEDAATTVSLGTNILTFLNIPQLSPIFRSINKNRSIHNALKAERGEALEDVLNRIKLIDPNKQLRNETIKARLKDSGLEAVEEIVNVISEEVGLNQGREATGQDTKSLAEIMSSKDTWAAAFWGAVGGTMQNVILNKMPKWVDNPDGTKTRTNIGKYNNEQYQKVYEEQIEALKTRLTDFITAKDDLVKYAESGNTVEYQKAVDRIFNYNTFNSIVKGVEEQLIGEYERIARLSKEEAEIEGFTEDYKQKAITKIQDIKAHTKEWNKTLDKYSDDTLETAGYPENIFSRYLNIYNTKQNINEREKSLQEFQAEVNESFRLKGTSLSIKGINEVISSIEAINNDILQSEIDLDNLNNIKQFDTRTQKRLSAQLINKYGSLDTAKKAIENSIKDLNQRIKEAEAIFKIERENFKLFKDPEGKLTEKQLDEQFNSVVLENSLLINQLTDFKNDIAKQKALLKQQEDSYAELTGRDGLSKFRELIEANSKEVENQVRNIEEKQAQETKKEAAKEIVNKPTIQPVELPSEESTTSLEDFGFEELKKESASEVLNESDEGPYAGEGIDTIDEQNKGLQKTLDGNEDGVVKDQTGKGILFDDRLQIAYDKLAYASTREYVENSEGFVVGRTSNELNPDTEPRLLTPEFKAGTQVKVKFLESKDFKPYKATRVIEFYDFVDGKLTKRSLNNSIGELITFDMLDNSIATKPIGVYDSNNNLIATLHDTSYIREQRVVDSQNNLEENAKNLLQLRKKITNDFQTVTINSKTNGFLAKVKDFIPLNTFKFKLNLGIATSNMDLKTDRSTIKPVINKNLVKGQVYLISETPNGTQIAIPLKSKQLKDSPEIQTKLTNVLKDFVDGKLSYDQLQKEFSKYINSSIISEVLIETQVGNKKEEFFEKAKEGKNDKYYIDYDNRNTLGIAFGKSGSKKYFINQKSKQVLNEAEYNDLISKFNEFLGNVYFNVNFDNIKEESTKDYLETNIAIYELPNGYTVFDNPVIGIETNTLSKKNIEVKEEVVEKPVDDTEAKKADIERRKRLANAVIDYVWDRLAKQGITNADPIIGTRDTIENVDSDKFWSNVIPQDLQRLKDFYVQEKQKQLESYKKYKGEFDPTSGTFTSDDTSFYDNKIKDVDAEIIALEQSTTQSEIDAAKAEIERRRQEELNKGKALIKEFGNVAQPNGNVEQKLKEIGGFIKNTLGWNITYINASKENNRLELTIDGQQVNLPEGANIRVQAGNLAYAGFNLEDIINAKYDAELAALESQETIKELPKVTKPKTFKSSNPFVNKVVDKKDVTSKDTDTQKDLLPLQNTINNLVTKDKIDKIC
jgi:hypothetical protein